MSIPEPTHSPEPTLSPQQKNCSKTNPLPTSTSQNYQKCSTPPSAASNHPTSTNSKDLVNSPKYRKNYLSATPCIENSSTKNTNPLKQKLRKLNTKKKKGLRTPLRRIWVKSSKKIDKKWSHLLYQCIQSLTYSPQLSRPWQCADPPRPTPRSSHSPKTSRLSCFRQVSADTAEPQK